jgi:phenylalanyl-tRNA synthetase alpha chain
MLQNLTKEALDIISKASSLQALEDARIQYLGKNGLISIEMRKLGTLDFDAKKTFGVEINNAKTKITAAIDVKYAELKAQHIEQKLLSEKIDMSLPGRSIRSGSIHPITQATQELLEIFVRLGFEIKEGPSIEDDFHNFTALNIAEHHPARQMHDTFYLNDNKLLRTHTSPVQIRSMMAGRPPYRLCAPGRTYRCDSDMTHTPMFHQIEILMIDKDVHMGHLKHFITEFIAQFFERNDIEVRLRPSFFPFTEPSAEVDIRMKASGKWLEVLGCGMVHPNVLRNAKVEPGYQGFAVGMGVERLAMLKYGIADLRQMFEGDKRFLDHYSFSCFDIPSFAGGLTR